jgi:6,7-dimethyl-8-ribityllumazine synthase
MKVEKKSGEAQKTNARLLILEARFYAEMCDELAAGAIAAIERAGAKWDRVAVPGALELPGAIAMAHHSEKYDGYVALGCVLRGETTHYDIVANESARGIMNLTLAGLCIGNGILTCENEAQAWARARVAEMDKGGGAAEAALAMIRLARSFGGRKRTAGKRKARAK